MTTSTLTKEQVLQWCAENNFGLTEVPNLVSSSPFRLNGEVATQEVTDKLLVKIMSARYRGNNCAMIAFGLNTVELVGRDNSPLPWDSTYVKKLLLDNGIDKPDSLAL